VNWEIVYAKQALKDAKKLAASGLKQKAQAIPSKIRRRMKSWPGILPAPIQDESIFNIVSSMKYSSRKKSFVCYECGLIMNKRSNSYVIFGWLSLPCWSAHRYTQVCSRSSFGMNVGMARL